MCKKERVSYFHALFLFSGVVLLLEFPTLPHAYTEQQNLKTVAK